MIIREIIKLLVGVEVTTDDMELLKKHPEEYVKEEDRDKIKALIELLEGTKKVVEENE